MEKINCLMKKVAIAATIIVIIALGAVTVLAHTEKRYDPYGYGNFVKNGRVYIAIHDSDGDVCSYMSVMYDDGSYDDTVMNYYLVAEMKEAQGNIVEAYDLYFISKD